MHIHLDAIGGISGNMFVGAMLACFPEFQKLLPEQIDKAGFPELVTLRTEPKNDGILQGVYFNVMENTAGNHDHTHYSDIRENIAAGSLEETVKKHALGIFLCLAEAAARVHGVDVDRVTFHEVGAWDSIADVVCAAFLIEAGGATSWSVSSLPRGSGRVDTSHGPLPVPAPAVACLLQGCRFHDDGLEGERVTPTGAAILKYLDASAGTQMADHVLTRSGFGFGSREFPGISNVLRAMVFERDDANQPWRYDEVTVLSFEVDDQTPEDLAGALAKLRAMPGVLDVNETPAAGKKQRIGASVRVLVRAAEAPEVIGVCFNDTATLGIRVETAGRAVLARQEVEVEVAGRRYRAKVVRRPNGELSAKAELDDILQQDLSLAQRERLRREIETRALAAVEPQCEPQPGMPGEK